MENSEKYLKIMMTVAQINELKADKLKVEIKLEGLIKVTRFYELEQQIKELDVRINRLEANVKKMVLEVKPLELSNLLLSLIEG